MPAGWFNIHCRSVVLFYPFVPVTLQIFLCILRLQPPTYLICTNHVPVITFDLSPIHLAVRLHHPPTWPGGLTLFFARQAVGT